MRIEGKSYEEICRNFLFDIPEHFNMGVACSDKTAADDPDRTALIKWCEDDKQQTTSFGELSALSNQLANGLCGLDAKSGDRIGIILSQSVETMLSHFAIYKAGMIAVPLARLFQPDALQYRLDKAGVSIIITNRFGADKIAAIRSSLNALRHVIVIDEVKDNEIAWPDLLAEQSNAFTPVNTTPDTPALIVFTSGTTGPPKGALHGHRVLLGHMPSVCYQHEFFPKDGDLAWTPADWAWAGGLFNVSLPALYCGVPVVFGGFDRFDAERAFRLMSETGVRNSFLPPTALRLMKGVKDGAKRFPLQLRSVVSGGEALGAETHQWAVETLGVQINEIYGQTECNLVLSCCGAVGVMKPGSIGKPTPGHQIAILDESGKPLPPGQQGEVAIKRPHPVMFLEYWQDKQATNKKFKDEWMLTGDQCFVDDGGYYHFVGRDDDVMSIAGYRVGPSEIEDSLSSHEAVRLSAVVGKPDPIKGETIKAFIVLNDGFEASDNLAEALRAHVKTHHSANIFPSEIGFVDEIPLTTTGKVIRRHFREQVRQEAENGN